MINAGFKIVGNESQMTPGLQVYNRRQTKNGKLMKQIRVAAYCRVSTDLKVQQSSLETQMAVFQRVIDEHPGWELAGIYADKGLSGTSAAKRVEFNRMIQDAKDGNIDYILAKSTSRFARNTVDTLYYTRMLRELGVGVYFEEQNIDTNSIASEMLLTIHAAFAQEESHSISENMKRGFRNRFAMGIPKWTRTYGYRRVAADVWEIEESEAEVIRWIYEAYLEGWPLNKIAADLEQRKIKTAAGGSVWTAHSISTILHNEKYIGDVAMQKCYTIDHITHKKVSNKNAEITRYYKKDHHPAIIDRETFKQIQIIAAMKDRHKGSYQYPFYGFLRCPYCGERMINVKLISRGYERGWTCAGAENNEKHYRYERTSCPEYFVKEKYIFQAVAEALKMLDHGQLQRLAEKDETAEDLLAYKTMYKTGDPIEYVMLYRTVDRITFDTKEEKPDWFTMVVFWKCGLVSRVKMNYRRPSEVPVTMEDCEFKDNKLFLYGKETNGQISAYNSILNILEACSQIRIYDLDYDEETDEPTLAGNLIPNVLGSDSVKGEKVLDEKEGDAS